MLISPAEATRWNLRNHNCKHVLLGVSHDAGYAPFLDEVLRDEAITKRVTIIEGPPLVRELSQSGVRIIQFDELFRTAKLADKLIGPPVVTPAASALSTWAGVTSVTPPPAMKMPNITVPLSTKNGNLPPKKPSWNPGPRGLDESIIAKPAVLEVVKRRTGNNKLCNNHYLRGPCAKGDECSFEHQHKVTPEEIKAIASLTRLVGLHVHIFFLHVNLTCRPEPVYFRPGLRV